MCRVGYNGFRAEVIDPVQVRSGGGRVETAEEEVDGVG